MNPRFSRIWHGSKGQAARLGLALMILLAGCRGPAAVNPAPTSTPTAPPALATPAALETPVPNRATSPRAPDTPAPAGLLHVRLNYPRPDSELTMGQQAKFIVQVTDESGQSVNDAQVTVTVRDPAGQVMGSIPAPAGSDGAFRAAWPLPHRSMAGVWQAEITARSARASANAGQGRATGSFRVSESTSERLLHSYGFWLDAPALGNIEPQVMDEKGDAQNGRILWGGFVPAMHILPDAWVEIDWRQGNFKLDSPEAVRRFLLNDVGDLGFIPIRALGPFEHTRFKNWDAWRVGARPELAPTTGEWMVFYVPEVDKTFALGSTVTLPPVGADPHAALRQSFAVDATVHAVGVAPEPLPRLLPAPELVSPALGAEFIGTAQPIVLRWQPVKPLAAGEYYEVRVNYNYSEASPTLVTATRDTQFTVPVDLYSQPNCEVFNWQVVLKRQTAVDAKGRPAGETLSHASLYSYVLWRYPAGAEKPFTPHCQNAQY